MKRGEKGNTEHHDFRSQKSLLTLGSSQQSACFEQNCIFDLKITAWKCSGSNHIACHWWLCSVTSLPALGLERNSHSSLSSTIQPSAHDCPTQCVLLPVPPGSRLQMSKKRGQKHPQQHILPYPIPSRMGGLSQCHFNKINGSKVHLKLLIPYVS